MRVPSQPQSETQTETQSQIQTQSQSNLPYQPPTPSDEKNKLIQSPSQPNRFSNSSRFSGSGRLSSPNYPILPIQLDIMDLNGIEGLLVEYVSYFHFFFIFIFFKLLNYTIIERFYYFCSIRFNKLQITYNYLFINH